MLVLVTGNAEFLGFHTSKRLLERGDSVIGIDVVDVIDAEIAVIHHCIELLNAKGFHRNLDCRGYQPSVADIIADFLKSIVGWLPRP